MKCKLNVDNLKKCLQLKQVSCLAHFPRFTCIKMSKKNIPNVGHFKQCNLREVRNVDWSQTHFLRPTVPKHVQPVFSFWPRYLIEVFMSNWLKIFSWIILDFEFKPVWWQDLNQFNVREPRLFHFKWDPVKGKTTTKKYASMYFWYIQRWVRGEECRKECGRK